MESCERVRDRLLDFVEGELADGEFRRLEAHVAGCASCAREVAALRETVACVRDLPVSPVPDRLLDGLAADVRERIGRESAGQPPLWQRLAGWLRDLPGAQPLPAVSAAAALGLLLAIGLGSWPRVPDGLPSGAAALNRESLSIARNLDVLEQFELLEDLDLLEHWPLLRSPAGDHGVRRG